MRLNYWSALVILFLLLVFFSSYQTASAVSPPVAYWSRRKTSCSPGSRQMQSDWRYGQWRRIYVAVCKWKVSLSYLKEAANNMPLPIVFIRQRCIRVILVAAYVASSAAKMCSLRGTDVWKAYVLLTPHHQTFFIFTPTDAASHHVNWGNLEDFMQLLHTKYDPITLNRLMCDSHWTEWDQMC